MAKRITSVVAQFAWTAVKEVTDDIKVSGLPYGSPPQFQRKTFYDVWEWNVWKLKWVRLSNTACGFGSKSAAVDCASERSDEIQAMFDSNKQIPTPL